MSADKAKELGLKPLAKIVGYSEAGVDPSIMGIAPIAACKKVFKKTGLKASDIDLVEANEAFCRSSSGSMQRSRLPERESERKRRRGSYRPSDRRQRRTYPGNLAVRHEEARRHSAAWQPCASAAAKA